MTLKCILAAILAGVVVHAAPTNFTGFASFYEPDGAIGACGVSIQSTDFAVGVSSAQLANGANCLRPITVTYQGMTVNATVEDLCTSCAFGDLDLTISAFEKLASPTTGLIKVTWEYD